MRTFLLAILVFVLGPTAAVAEENANDREFCLMLLPWIAGARPDLLDMDMTDATGVGLAIVAHTRRKEVLNCVYRYEKPTMTYLHALYSFASKQVVVMRLAVENGGVIDMKKRTILEEWQRRRKEGTTGNQ